VTKTDDRYHIRSAASDDAELRRHCIEGAERYRKALIIVGYIPAGTESGMTDALYSDSRAAAAACADLEFSHRKSAAARRV
jgi:hypothetical protein